ncbi:MAG: uncharacterized protein JWM09_354 [Francisellaceae bacterium]|nr:uncharacterized protein [Francisellaceae bacterium]
MIARWEDVPVGFFSTQINPKTSRIYLRWVIVSPAFHKLNLGTLSLNQIMHYYGNSLGMELYTRNANESALRFYSKYGFSNDKLLDFFDFSKKNVFSPEELKVKLKDILYKKVLSLPSEDGVSEPKAFTGFYFNTNQSKKKCRDTDLVGNENKALTSLKKSNSSIF